MTGRDDGGLGKEQWGVVSATLGHVEVVADMSWGLVDTRVLRVRSEGADFVVKAAGACNHHIGREINAHETATNPLLRTDSCSRLVAADREHNILITTFVPGSLVEGTSAELSRGPQAGR
ncbi:hypothetical protein B1813_05430 [Saccharomonospora piscinae]|uniref:Uncharacterized protein n=1 Tax=Saccharomonospora piscinae TaxID=687388 RepID=A0A1V9AAJ3_SACPI|nr:hypothetical protein [Saccharomonospora piscinae]OQO93954.1 hypothetical protein B1813_05430 [Saccharomonospora piscinae]